MDTIIADLKSKPLESFNISTVKHFNKITLF